MVRTSFVQRRVRRGRTLKAILDPIVVAQAHREPPSPGRPASGGYDDTRRNRLSAIEKQQFRSFLVEMPGSALPYKRERDSNANGRHPR